MKFSVAVVSALSASVASAGTLGFFGGNEFNAADCDSVPGENPLCFCPGDRSKDTISIDTVDLLPNPPLPGATLEIKATGSVLEPIEEGAYVVLQVKYGLIRLINQRENLCDQLGNVDLECPVEKGKLVITKSVDIPKEVPPGKYTVLADVYDKDDIQITCLQAAVVFTRGGVAGEL